MGRKLIIAEKPSQAREYANALGVRSRADGYLENEAYIITWCYGHLLELERPETYMDLDRVGKRWSLNRLPVLPKTAEFRRVVKSGAEKQYQIVLHLLRSSEIEEVICGTDADREGQLLFQEIWEASKCQKPLKRLWISSLTASSILEGMNNLQPAQSVAGLAAAGHGRAYADWDFGMNLTEGFTSLFGSYDTLRKKPNVISIGRVQTPTLALIVEREWEILSFNPQPFFEIRAEFATSKGNYIAKWYDITNETKRIAKRGEAEEIIQRIQGKPAFIQKLTKKDLQEPPPLLFDLTSLTVAASKKYGFSAEKVLKIAQSLYEKKGITYPRTDCPYLSKDLIPKLANHLEAVNQEPYRKLVAEAIRYGVPQGKRVINTISAHHAIIPTTEKTARDRLTRDEQNLYDLIVRRFIAVWYPPAKYSQTDVDTVIEGEHFAVKGKILKNPGWKVVYDYDKDEIEDGTTTVLPPLDQGQEVETKALSIEEKTTKPPKRYSQGDLLKAMEGAGKQVDDEILRQQLKGKGLGTVATRPAIIESLIDRGYIYQEQKALKPTVKGTELIQLIKKRLAKAQLLISAEMTGQMEFNLSKVEKGKLTLEAYISDVEMAIRQIIEELRTFEQTNGKMPIAVGSKPLAPKSITGGVHRTLAKKDKSGSKIADEGLTLLGKCPRCGHEVIEGQKGFGCSNWKNGCHFVIWKKQLCGKTITPNQVKSLLKKGRTPLIKGFKSNTGKKFSAYLVWDKPEEGKLKFEFEQ
ncbi:DNA topoisomerase 3 [Desulfosporosinus acididurans]|uniref:DNA topoisomerase n=1 Tax=Desulfosporosinus acididurans TaxID=476652 RepID=A0A0J1FNX2_9FIRM|nr:type IA DNA topoisomerase [Desulfosporosinus acididurans]KLU65185.1 DNA topoisomerase 3 [Desulfosporosinus acididurans]